MDYHIPERPDRSLLIGRQTTKWSLWDVVFHENDSNLIIPLIVINNMHFMHGVLFQPVVQLKSTEILNIERQV